MAGSRARGYDPHEIERRWQARWREARSFEARDDGSRPRFFNFDGGPFPNGPLHMGHVRTFTLGDVMARYRRMRGDDVLYGFEFDAFGLPNELAAEARGVSPEQLTRDNIARQRAQMERLGYSYDWRHVHVTCDPRWYKWTQHLFLLLYERGLIYRDRAELNWCPSCHTTLAHIQVVDGACWRCDHPVEQRELTQWFVRLSQRSEILAERIARLDGWSEQVRALLAGFLGRASGFELDFAVAGGGVVTAFARDQAALAEAAALVAAPGQRQLAALLASSPRAAAVADYVAATRAEAGRARRRDDEAAPASSAVDTGLRARHPATGAWLPIFVSRAVRPSFATGVEVRNRAPAPVADEAAIAIAATPPAMASGVSGAATSAAPRPAVHFHVHDWLVSRQRAWGTPIPMVRCPRCGEVPVARAALPVRLPPWQPGRRGLAEVADFVHTACPRCGAAAERETDTLDCYFDVVWCFLACATRLDEGFAFTRDDFARWLPVRWFHNGVDSFFYAHLYRFIGQVLHEAGILDGPEPIERYHGHDAVLAGGRKMSKHHGTAVAPDALLDEYGTDVVRVHVLWSASPLKKVEWTPAGLDKAERLLGDVWRWVSARSDEARALPPATAAPPGKLGRSVDRVVRRVTSLVESYRVSGCLEEISLLVAQLGGVELDAAAFAYAARALVRLLAPFAPHLCEELWERLGGAGLVALAPWPEPAG